MAIPYCCAKKPASIMTEGEVLRYTPWDAWGRIIDLLSNAFRVSKCYGLPPSSAVPVDEGRQWALNSALKLFTPITSEVYNHWRETTVTVYGIPARDYVLRVPTVVVLAEQLMLALVKWGLMHPRQGDIWRDYSLISGLLARVVELALCA